MSVISLSGLPRVEHAVETQHGVQQTSAGRISLFIHENFHDAEEAWRYLETRGVCVNAQTFVRAKLWFETVSAPRGARLAVAVGCSDVGAPLFVWPFQAESVNGVSCLRWIGWEHANYQMGLHTLDFARKVQPGDMKALVQQAADLAEANAALLKYQPVEWDGAPNPFALLPQRPSSSNGHAVLLDKDFDNLYRNKFSGKSRNTARRKEKKLHGEDSFEIAWAHSPGERRPLLEEFFRQKSRQFSELGISDAFADKSVQDFYHALASLPSGQDGTLEIASLKVDGEILAIACGIRFRDKFETLLTSIGSGPLNRYSPGAMLAKFQIEDACEKGLNFFDMGVGDAPHKTDWCDVQVPLFDTAIAFDEKGYAATLPYIAITAGKRYIKNSRALWTAARFVRNALFGKQYKKQDVVATARLPN